ncbi:hypothetical protein C8Q73DRAFT_748644 [Cubamyces lactineus]|nr:hypothetical protein C8Q73DRAFT_748644 [Cubamyces lactineus]
MAEDDVERVDWGNDEDEQQVSPESYSAYAPRDPTGGYSGEDAEDAVSLGGDDEDEREFYAHHSTEQTTVTGSVLLTKSTVMSHSTKRDSQRQPSTSSQRARTPSQNQNSESPNSGLRRTHSASTLTPAPLTHALPPKPVLVPPLFRPPSPARSGTRASSMVHRPKKSNGPGKSNMAADGGDPLPPDWEIRYPRDGSKGIYYYNVKTETSTWERPRLPLTDTSPLDKDRVWPGTGFS